MIFYLDVTVAEISSPTTTHTRSFATGDPGFLTAAGAQYTPGLSIDNPPLTITAPSGGTVSTGDTSQPSVTNFEPRQPNDYTVRILHELAGANRVAGIDPETYNLVGHSATLCGVGTGGDGTTYTSSDPLHLGTGTVQHHRRDGKLQDVITIRPTSRLWRTACDNLRTIVGYRDGLRFSGGSEEAEITGYTAVPTEFTLQAAVMLSRSWSIGTFDDQTIASGGSNIQFYFDRVPSSSVYRRQLKLGYRTTGGSTIILEGPEFDADETVKFLSVRVDTAHSSGSGVKARFGVGDSYSDVEDTSNPFSYTGTAATWKLGRYLTSTTDTADTVIGAWSLFSVQLSDDILTGRQRNPMTGDESDLVWFYPGTSAGGFLLDLALVNAGSPLDATITSATAAPLLLGNENLAGTKLPPYLGHVHNAPMSAIDAARKIYRLSDAAVSAIVEVKDRQNPYTIEAVYETLIDFVDNPPTSAGNVTVTPYFGGLIRIHTEQDGVENTADLYGHSLWDFGLSLGSDFGNSLVSWSATDFDPVFTSPPWTWEADILLEDEVANGVIYESDHLRISSNDFHPGRPGYRRINISVSTVSIGNDRTISAPIDTRLRLRIEGWDDGSGGNVRVLINGKENYHQTGPVLLKTASTSSPELGSTTIDTLYTLPFMLWSNGGGTTAEAEARARQYMFRLPPTDADDLEHLFYRYTTSRTTLDDEVGGADGTISSGAHWNPGLAAADRLSAAQWILDQGGVTATYESHAFNYIPGAIAYAWSRNNTDSSTVTTAGIVYALLIGGHLYMLANKDNSVTIGLIRDPATTTPDHEVRVEFSSGHNVSQYHFQGSHLDIAYDPNFAHTKVRADGTDENVAFNARGSAALITPIGGNETLYNDRPALEARRLYVESYFRHVGPASELQDLIAPQHDSPRPTVNFDVIGRSDSATARGYTSINPGDIVKLLHERFSGGEKTVFVLRSSRTRMMDKFEGY